MSIDRAAFFATVRKSLFGGKLSAAQTKGMDAILDEWERRRLTDLRWFAYMLATVLGECGANMLPVREGFKKTDAEARAYVKRQGYKYAAVVNGQVYYGRGLVQLTWHCNYVAMGKLLGIDLAGNPDLALQPDIAAQIMFEGMIRGTFTTKKLSDYFSATEDDPLNARRIINGTDKAAKFKGFYSKFLAGLQASATASPVPSAPATVPSPTPIVVPAGKPPIVPPAGADPADFTAKWLATKPEADPDVFVVQWQLRASGYNPGGIDGLWGGMTSGAISGFLNDIPGKSPIKSPLSADEFHKVKARLLNELATARAGGFTRPIAEERANPTSEVLAEKAPEIVPVKRNKIVAFFAAAGAFVMSAFNGVVSFFEEALDWLTPVKDFASDVPTWVWLAVAGAAALFIGINSAKGVNRITESVQTGERP